MRKNIIFRYVHNFLLQLLVSRLQKERDEAKSECKELHDKVEIQQTQFQKLLREKEILHAELEVYKERLDKLQSSVQKIHVSVSVFLYRNLLSRHLWQMLPPKKFFAFGENGI